MSVVAVIFFESVDDFFQRCLVLRQGPVFSETYPDDAYVVVGNFIDYR